jgi:hypothetical protein
LPATYSLTSEILVYMVTPSDFRFHMKTWRHNT